MNFVESITLANFQKHRKIKLDLVPGINVIAGESNRGKSSIIRAFARLCSNTPSGPTCIRFGKTKASVTITVNRGNVRSDVRYTKSKTGGTSYSLDQSHYKRCGKIVPDEIKDFIGVIPEINIQPQYKQFFLLDARSSQDRAKQLARGTNIDIISYVLTEARRKVHQFESEFKANKEKADEAAAELKLYANVERAEKLLALADKLLSHIRTNRDTVRTLKSLGDSLLLIESSERELKKLPSTSEISRMYAEIVSIESALEKLYKCRTDLCMLDKADKSGASSIASLKEELRKLDDEAQELFGRISNLIAIKDSLRWLDDQIAQKDTEIKTRKAKLGSVCKSCGRPF